MKRTSLISNRGRMTRVFGFALSECDKLAVGCDLCEIQCLELVMGFALDERAHATLVLASMLAWFSSPKRFSSLVSRF